MVALLADHDASNPRRAALSECRDRGRADRRGIPPTLTPVALIAASAAALGTMVLLRGRDARALVFAVTVTMLVAPLAIEPAPTVLTLAFREVAALLAGYVLWIAIRTLPVALVPPRLGGAVEAAFVAAAFVLGLLVAGSGSGPAGPPALAAAVAIGLAAVNLLLFAPDPLRLGIGAMLFLLASSLAAGWLGGRLVDGSNVAIAVALLASAVATAWISVNAATARGELSGAIRPHDAGGAGGA